MYELSANDLNELDPEHVKQLLNQVPRAAAAAPLPNTRPTDDRAAHRSKRAKWGLMM